MLSYRHAFHAGNFADVLKHTVLVACLDYLKKKDKSFVYYDTHAGPGCYSLESVFAQKNNEYTNGISKIWNSTDPTPLLSAYLETVRHFNTGTLLTNYPGSPLIAQYNSRLQDRMILCELHKAEFAQLNESFGSDKRVQIWCEDGFERTLKMLPPSERRGLVLVDPPYELKQDYERVVEFLQNAYRKFAQGVYLLWYPIVERDRIDTLHNALRRSGIRNIQAYELGIKADTLERGMTGSGMIVINPPWTLKEKMVTTLDLLKKRLETEYEGYETSVQLVEE